MPARPWPFSLNNLPCPRCHSARATSRIGAYFAGHGAPVATVATHSVNVSVGGTVPNSVALFPPPYDLITQVSDPSFLYFVWGQKVVIVDAETNVVNAIIPDVAALAVTGP
jgi:hypothetical protein